METMKQRIGCRVFEKTFLNPRTCNQENKWMVSEETIEKLRDMIVTEENNHKIEMDQIISFYDLEIEFLKSLPDEKIKRLFDSLLCFEKLRWHESGWIRFEIDELAELGGLKTLKCEDFADLVPFGLKMRVTGSKNAVSTYYSIGWTIEKERGEHGGMKVGDVFGTECAKKLWEVVEMD